MQTGQGQRADEPPIGLIRGVELLHLGDGRTTAETGETADQLDVAEVTGRQRVEVAAAEKGQALDGPGPDLGDRQQASIARGRLDRVDSASTLGSVSRYLPLVASFLVFGLGIYLTFQAVAGNTTF
jgi:hypothetical protein